MWMSWRMRSLILDGVVPDDVVEICLHVFEYEIDVFVVLGSEHVEQFYYVGVVELVQQSDLSECSLGVCRVLERIKDLFETDCGLRLFVYGFPDVSVGAAPNFLHEFKSLKDMLLDFLTHFLFI